MIKLIAEIGCNHMGNLDTALEMISVAARVCKVDVVKFQKRNNKELFTPEQFNAPHPVPANAFGESYGAHREALELTIDQHRILKEYCESEKVTYATSVWDMSSAKEVAKLNPALIKIPSATNLHFGLHDWLCANYGGEIHVSTGMTTPQEIERVVEFFESRGRAKDVVLYSCTSGYPIKFEEICLLEITNLIEKFGDRVKCIGFSGHHLGIAADIAAMSGFVLNGRLHPHITLSNPDKAFGGHLEPGTNVFTFAVVTIGVLPDSLDLGRLDDKNYR